MPYVNIPETNLDASIATQIGKLKGQFETTVQTNLDSIKEDLKDGCPTPTQAESVKTRINSIKELSVNVTDRLNRFKKISSPLSVASKAILTVIPVLKGLPIPGLALTAGVTSTFSDLLHLVKEFGTQLKTSSDSITSLVNQTGALTNVLKQASDLSSRVDIVFQFCALSEESEIELNREDLNKIISGTPGEVANSIRNLNNVLGTNIQVENSVKAAAEQQAFNQQPETYTGPDGTVYTLKIVETPSDFTRAIQFQAIAENRNGVRKFESEKSFSSNPDILKRQLKFNIDNSQV